MFEDEKLRALEQAVYAECEEMGTVEKITNFPKHPAGVVIVDFAQPTCGQNRLNGQIRKEGKRDRLYGRRLREGSEES